MKWNRHGVGLVLAAWAMTACGDDGVAPVRGDRLVYLAQPSNGPERALLPAIVLAIRDAGGNTDITAAIPVTIALGANPGGATLSGTVVVDAVAGVATFDDLRIDQPGGGYTLVASAGSLPEVESTAFDVWFVSALAVGMSHACVLRSGGAAYCWGYNGYGQIGDGSTVNRTGPVAVGGGIGFSALTPGAFHTCGLTPSGEAFCWGANSFGRLGDGSETQRTAPVAVAAGHVFSSLSAGLDHTCAIETGTHSAYCWGRNQSGQRGDGTMTTSLVPVSTFGASLLGFDRVSAGGQHSCALAPGGAVFCWGLNTYGQLGDGTTGMRFVPTAVSGGFLFQSLAVNNNDASWESTCAVTGAGRAYCWGLNNYGQLGRGTTGGQSDTASAVFGGLQFASVSPGTDHACGVTTAGEGYCWGRNNFGQLGNGAAGVDQDTNTPTLVTGGHVFRHVGAGRSFSCGLTVDGNVYCWGRNQVGQLGDGTTATHSEPVLVGGLPPATVR